MLLKCKCSLASFGTGEPGWVGFVGPFSRDFTPYQAYPFDAVWTHVSYPVGDDKHKAKLSQDVDIHGIGAVPFHYMNYRSGYAIGEPFPS